MPSYLVFHFRFDTAQTDPELLSALLMGGGFEGVEELTDGLDAYLPADRQQATTKWVERLADRFDFRFDMSELPDKNWNAEWEANFQPLRIDDWLGIRAAFHEPMTDVDIELLIDPKMAFGTGHHATTHMMCSLMRGLNWTGRSVFDYGCGTGILAILAKRLGSGPVAAIDIEAPSYENTLENAEINQVELELVGQGNLTEFLEGDLRRCRLSTVKAPPAEVQNRHSQNHSIQPPFDYILANINRNVILASLEPLQTCLAADGRLLVSGILQRDAALVLQSAREAGWEALRQQQQDDWMAWVFRRASDLPT